MCVVFQERSGQRNFTTSTSPDNSGLRGSHFARTKERPVGQCPDRVLLTAVGRAGVGRWGEARNRTHKACSGDSHDKDWTFHGYKSG